MSPTEKDAGAVKHEPTKLRTFKMRCGRLVKVPDEPGAIARALRYGWREVLDRPTAAVSSGNPIPPVSK